MKAIEHRIGRLALPALQRQRDRLITAWRSLSPHVVRNADALAHALPQELAS